MLYFKVVAGFTAALNRCVMQFPCALARRGVFL